MAIVVVIIYYLIIVSVCYSCSNPTTIGTSILVNNVIIASFFKFLSCVSLPSLSRPSSLSSLVFFAWKAPALYRLVSSTKLTRYTIYMIIVN